MTEVASVERGPKRPLIIWDLGISIILMILGLALAAFLTFSALFLVMSADSCGASSTCNTTQLTAGWLVAMIFPAIAVIVAIVVGVVLIVRRRVSFWVPIAGCALAVAGWFVGVLMVFGSVPGFRP